MAEKDLQTMIDAFRAFVRSRGWSIVAEKEIAYGYQFVVTDGVNKTPVDLFASGKTLIQGKPSALQTELRSWYQVSTTVTETTGVARIGLDESGKGDYFGPLVIGAVYVVGYRCCSRIYPGTCRFRAADGAIIASSRQNIAQGSL